jgi:1,4-dihydroxy-2-naphthoate octaprenyltransferase
MNQLFLLFFRMSRPLQLVSIIMVFSWGTLLALAQGFSYSWSRFIISITAGLFISISIHYVNEYVDVETDRLTQRTAFSGGSGALPASKLPPSVALKGASIALVLGLLVAIIGVFNQIIPANSLVILGVAAVLGWGYSLRPISLAWRGWGELDNAFLGGVLLPIYGYSVFSNQIDWFIFSAVIPFGMLAFTNLLATTWADKWADAQVGKYTLATRYSKHKLRFLYAGVAGLAYLWVIWQSPYPPVITWASFIALPISVWGLLRYTRQTNPTPSVFAMITFLTIQLITWAIIVF